MSCSRRSVPFSSFPITFCILICVISSSRCCGFHHQNKLPSKSKSFSIDNKWTICCTRHSSISLIHADVRVQACWVHVATQPRSRGPPSCLSSLCVHLCLYCVCNKLALVGIQWHQPAVETSAHPCDCWLSISKYNIPGWTTSTPFFFFFFNYDFFNDVPFLSQLCFSLLCLPCMSSLLSLMCFMNSRVSQSVISSHACCLHAKHMFTFPLQRNSGLAHGCESTS